MPLWRAARMRPGPVSTGRIIEPDRAQEGGLHEVELAPRIFQAAQCRRHSLRIIVTQEAAHRDQNLRIAMSQNVLELRRGGERAERRHHSADPHCREERGDPENSVGGEQGDPRALARADRHQGAAIVALLCRASRSSASRRNSRSHRGPSGLRRFCEAPHLRWSVTPYASSFAVFHLGSAGGSDLTRLRAGFDHR